MSRGDKRRAVLDGALAVFARDGYSRASIDAIAAEAGVSTRTLYNHFGAKAALFEAVITDSATRVADDQVAIIEGWREEVDVPGAADAPDPDRLERDLVRLCTRVGRSAARFPDHFALVRQVGAESEHLPPEALAAWRRAGPDRVMAARADALARLQELGLLTVADPLVAARHLTQLADRAAFDRARERSAEEASPEGGAAEGGAAERADDEVEQVVACGVHTFLYGYLPPAGRS